MTCESIDLRIPALTAAQMRCAECVSRLCDAVASLDGVESAVCDQAGGTLTVCWDAGAVSLDAIERRVLVSARGLAERYAHTAYRLTGLD